ncbi:hypothetical protein [Nocardioides gansuensis]|uniref:hypothetical protein n=1 Tax=Nocardioides gansuensis TaxID=2138300 RepID=UPI0014021263|nr:hypothetical protein [Nocardioides gansuensis]
MDAKKVLLVLVVVFVGFWMFTDPNGLADTAKTGGVMGWDLLSQLFGAVIDFVSAL